jgi:hypothetical protein
MPNEPQWTRHVGNVSATLQLLCPELSGEQITEALDVEPTETSPIQDLETRKSGCMWCYDSSSHISSTDASEHVRHLLKTFLPIKSRLEDMRPPPHAIVRMHWESTIVGLAGPQIEADCITGLATLGASLLIDVVKIEEVDRA